MIWRVSIKLYEGIYMIWRVSIKLYEGIYMIWRVSIKYMMDCQDGEFEFKNSNIISMV
jgi:hypothetical protein